MLHFPVAMRAQEQASDGGRQVALRDFLNAMFYHRRAVAIVAATIVALGILAALLTPPSYRAEARLLPLSAGIYEMQTANVATSPTQVLDPLAVVNVEIQMLASLELHRKLIRSQLGANASPAAVNAALANLESHLHITKATDANVIELSYTARDPNEAAAVLRRLLDEYFRSRADVLTGGRVAFLAAQRDKVKAQLDAANAAIVTYQQQNDVVDITAQIAATVQEDGLLRQHKLETEAALADGQQNVAALQSAARGVPEHVELYSDNAEAARSIGEMQAQVLQLQGKRADLASRYMKGAPIVVQVDKQITGLQTAISRQKGNLVATRRTGRNQYFDSSQDRLTQSRAALAGAKARDATLTAQIAASATRLNHLIAVSDTVARLRLDRDVLADNFRTLFAQVQQAGVQLDQTSSDGSPNVRVIEAPTPPGARSNPPLLLIAGSIVAAILVAGATLLVLSSMRDTFLAPQEVERALSLPVLYAPVGHADLASSASRRDYGRLITAIDGVAGPGGTVILLLAPRSRAALQESSIGLGSALNRRTPGRVMLVRFAPDAPVPSDGSRVQITEYEGMATGVIGTAACSNRRLDAKLLADLRTLYDYVIVTAPPTSSAFESIELSQAADMTLLVINAEDTRRPVALDLVAQVDRAGGRPLGVMLLDRHQHIPQILYRLLFERGPSSHADKRHPAVEDQGSSLRRKRLTV